MTEKIIGSCYNHEDPDLWYPELPRGSKTPEKIQQMALRINTAIVICEGCPLRQECLQEGIKPINLAYGIWGGLLPAQRIRLASLSGVKYSSVGGVKGEPRPARDLLRNFEKRSADNFFNMVSQYLKQKRRVV